MKFGVVIGVPDMALPETALTNLAVADVIYTAAGLHTPMAMLTHRLPVFQVGEFLICDDDGREIAFPRRDTARWPVEIAWYEEDQVEEAVLRCRRINEAW